MKGNSLIQTFLHLVQIDSPTSHEQKLADYIVSLLKPLVDEVETDKHGNVFARIKGKGEPVLFASHMDTVEPGRGVKPKLKNGYVVSDGTTILGADNKGAVAAMLELARLFHESKKEHRPIELLFTYSEEEGNYGAINFDYRKIKAQVGYSFDSVSPIGTIIQASPFYERFDITVTGRAAHASKPQEANNVLYFLSSFIAEINLGKLDDDSVMNIGVVQSGMVRNTIPGELTIKGEIRSFIESTLLYHKEYVLRKLHALINKHHMKVAHEFVRENPGYKHIDDTSLKAIQTVKRAMKSCNILPEINDAWGVSDSNIFNGKGIVCINLGDGVEGAHTNRERIKTKDLESILTLMKELCA